MLRSSRGTSPTRRALILLIAGLLSGLSGVGGCQQPNADQLDRLLVGEVLMGSELAANLRALCLPGGRLSGSPNGHQAEELIASKLRAYGLANVHFEPFAMTSWQDSATTVTVLGDTPRVLTGALALGNCLSTGPEGVTAELVDVGQGKPEEFTAVGERLRGRFALVREGGQHRSRKMKAALALGAAGLVQISALEDMPRVGQCHSEPRPEPGVVISGSDGAELCRRLEAVGTVRLNIVLTAEAWPSQPRNVVAEIPGSGPDADDVVILGAHLDSWHLGEGAIDNGNGSSAILESARALAVAAGRMGPRPGWPSWKPRRTVRFVWFMGEEHGLHGSTAYVEQHAAELDRIAVMVNADMPGAPRSLSTFGHPEVVDLLHGLAVDLPGYEIDPQINSASWTASDHAPFMKQGVCAVSLGGDLGDGVRFYHTSGDKYEVVDRRGTTQAASALAVLVRRLADAPTRPGQRLDPVKLAAEMHWDED